MQEEQKTNDEEEKVDPIIEEANWEEPDYAFIPKGNHHYRQEGYYLICQSCDLGHATFIGKDKVMVGQDEESKPILKTRKEIGMV